MLPYDITRRAQLATLRRPRTYRSSTKFVPALGEWKLTLALRTCSSRLAGATGHEAAAEPEGQLTPVQPPYSKMISAELLGSAVSASILRDLPPIISYSSMLSLQPSPEGPSVWLALTALIGLPTALWFYKCAMMVLFQRKIIYMGYVPPGAREEQLGVEVPVPAGVLCEEIQLQSERRIKLSGIIVRAATRNAQSRDPDAVIVYFQGNAGNPLNRVPVFERLLQSTSQSQTHGVSKPLDLAIVAVAPRSFWKSSSITASQHGLLSDYSHVLSYACSRFPSSTIVLYGHSLGGAAAVCLAAQLESSRFPMVRGLIVENPFLSIPAMVQALYPQRWLPYRYLTPFVLDRWDAGTAMRTAIEKPTGTLLERLSKNMLVLMSEKDEVVPPSMGKELYEVASRGTHWGGGEGKQDSPRRVVIHDALHEHAWKTRQWVTEVRQYLHRLR